MVGFRVLGVVKRETHLRRESFEIATHTLNFFFFFTHTNVSFIFSKKFTTDD